MQLDLLEWRSAPVEIIPFPASKRVGHIRRTADRIVNSRTDREADAYWKRAVEGLSHQMGKAGIADVRIEAELQAFRSSVHAELARFGYRSDGDAV